MRIAIDGNIGVGKTTLIKNLKKELKATVYKEEINKELLQKIYNKNNPETIKKFELLNQLHFLNATIYRDIMSYDDKNDFQIYDRSLSAHLHIFSKTLLSPANYLLYSGQQELLRLIHNFEKYDLQIVLMCSHKENMKRIKKRGRKEEKSIDGHYIQQLEQHHRSDDYEDICADLYTKTILFLDVTNLSEEEVTKEVLQMIREVQ